MRGEFVGTRLGETKPRFLSALRVLLHTAQPLFLVRCRRWVRCQKFVRTGAGQTKLGRHSRKSVPLSFVPCKVPIENPFETACLDVIIQQLHALLRAFRSFPNILKCQCHDIKPLQRDLLRNCAFRSFPAPSAHMLGGLAFYTTDFIPLPSGRATGGGRC